MVFFSHPLLGSVVIPPVLSSAGRSDSGGDSSFLKHTKFEILYWKITFEQLKGYYQKQILKRALFDVNKMVYGINSFWLTSPPLIPICAPPFSFYFYGFRNWTWTHGNVVLAFYLALLHFTKPHKEYFDLKSHKKSKIFYPGILNTRFPLSKQITTFLFDNSCKS